MTRTIWSRTEDRHWDQDKLVQKRTKTLGAGQTGSEKEQIPRDELAQDHKDTGTNWSRTTWTLGKTGPEQHGHGRNGSRTEEKHWDQDKLVHKRTKTLGQVGPGEIKDTGTNWSRKQTLGQTGPGQQGHWDKSKDTETNCSRTEQ